MDTNKRLKKILAIIFLTFYQISYSGEVDSLLDKLVEKNILEGWEAQEVRINTQEEVKSEISEGSHKTLPLWLQNIKLGGDIRLRYQTSKNDNLTYDRRRGRYRLRFFASTKVNEQVLAGFGFASGESSDPRSTNQTFKDNFGKKGLYIDYVYAEYYPCSWLSIAGGRSKNPLWLAHDMLWDSDINPEGMHLKTEFSPSSLVKIKNTAGFFILNESTANDDPYAQYIQQFISLRDYNSVFSLKASITYYDFRVAGKNALNYRPSILDGYLQSNTTSSGKYKYRYKPVTVDAKASMNLVQPIKVPLLSQNISNLSFFGGFVRNTAIGKNNSGWLAGISFGQEKVDDSGQFQFSFSQRRLEKDAWLDTYPDSDFYGGSTGVKGLEYILTLGVMRNFSIVFDYYDSVAIGTSKRERLVQADVNFKF